LAGAGLTGTGLGAAFAVDLEATGLAFPVRATDFASVVDDRRDWAGALAVAFLLFNTTLDGRGSALAFLDLRASGRERVAFTSFRR
jgi:hypothetical protein